MTVMFRGYPAFTDTGATYPLASEEPDGWRLAFAYLGFEDAYADLPRSRRRFEFYEGSGKHIGGAYLDLTDQPIVSSDWSYPGYSRWRDNLARVILDVPAEVVWHDPSYTDRPFYPLIQFADNEGAIGPAAVARLARDFVEHREAYAAHRLTTERDVGYYDEMAAVFTHAAPAGVVILS